MADNYIYIILVFTIIIMVIFCFFRYILIVYNKLSISIAFMKLSVCLIVGTFGPRDWYRNSGILWLFVLFLPFLYKSKIKYDL